VFQSATAKDAAELADAAAMFVVVRAKSNLEVLNGNLRKRPPASIHLREHLRQLGEVRRHPPSSRVSRLVAERCDAATCPQSGDKRKCAARAGNDVDDPFRK
jgi:hypothetical protein